MALQLRIISDHRRLLGDRSSAVFDRVGGNIGRSADNDWVLPDPQRFVSAHHARIHFRDGLYILEDTSTNGVYVNDDERPVSKRGAHVLQNGDILRFGEYQAVAMVETRPATADPAATEGPAGPVFPDDQGLFGHAATSSVAIHTSANSVEVLAAIGQISQADLGAALKTALDSGHPTVIDVPVDAEVPQPAVATWELPPLSHPEPAFGWPDP